VRAPLSGRRAGRLPRAQVLDARSVSLHSLRLLRGCLSQEMSAHGAVARAHTGAAEVGRARRAALISTQSREAVETPRQGNGGPRSVVAAQ
jgi:hypothetical protein